MTEFQPLSPDRSIAVRIAEQIAGRIQAGEFPVGTKLPAETELARQFGVSRPSVREALGALQFVGYIDSVRGSGSRVISAERMVEQSGTLLPEVTPREVLRLFEARLVIEPQVAAVAARDPDMDKLDRAESLIEGMSLVVSEPTLHGETDLRVHRALTEVCKNNFLRASAVHLLDVVASPQLRETRHQAWSNRVLPPIWGEQHREVVEAIRSRDAETAAMATWDHLASSTLNALTILASDPSVDAEAIDNLKSFLDDGPLGRVASRAGSPIARQEARSRARRSKS